MPDSAGTATALFTGVKTRLGMIGLDSRAAYDVCEEASRPGSVLTSLADWAAQVGKKTGVVSTARVT